MRARAAPRLPCNRTKRSRSRCAPNTFSTLILAARSCPVAATSFIRLIPFPASVTAACRAVSRPSISKRGIVRAALNASNVPRVGRVQIFQTFYYTRALSLAPSLAQFADARGREPGTIRGSQYSPSVFIGRTERGAFGGLSLFYDFQDRPDRKSSLISSTTTAGYAWDCCAALYFQRRTPHRTPRAVQLSLKRHRHVRHRTNRAALRTLMRAFYPA